MTGQSAHCEKIGPIGQALSIIQCLFKAFVNMASLKKKDTKTLKTLEITIHHDYR